MLFLADLPEIHKEPSGQSEQYHQGLHFEIPSVHHPRTQRQLHRVTVLAE